MGWRSENTQFFSVDTPLCFLLVNVYNQITFMQGIYSYIPSYSVVTCYVISHAIIIIIILIIIMIIIIIIIISMWIHLHVLLT
jgi:hypothetical protein